MPMPPHSAPRTPTGRRARRPDKGRWLVDHLLLVSLFGLLVLALLAEMPWVSRPVRSHLLQAAVVLVYTLIAAAGPASGRLARADWRGPGLWLAALVAWSALCALRAPFPAFAAAEMERVALGAGVFFLAAFVLRPGETRLLPFFLLGLGAAVAVGGLVEFGAGGIGSADAIHSVFGNHEQLGSFLVLLLPLGLALGLDREQAAKGRLLLAQGTALLIGAALLLARTRSAWFGAAAALLLLVFLTVRFSSVRLTRQNRALIIGPALLLVLAFAGLLLFGQLAPLVSRRAATLVHAGDDASLSDRLHRWRSACRMASERPVAGWGLGAWPVMQGRWTHQGDDVSEVLGAGTGHSNLAHDFWVQWAAETGGVGLVLQVGALAAFLLAGLRALPTLDRERRTLLFGCLGAAVAGAVDMVGAPSYTFPGVSSLFWVPLGLGVAMLREGGAQPPPRRADWLVPLGTGLVAALLVLGIGFDLRAGGRTALRGTLLVTALPPGPVAPGTRVLWTASFRAPDGALRPTAPGTVWRVTEGALTKTSPTYLFQNKDPQRSGWQGNVAPGASRVTATAYYWDQFSRPYEVSLPLVVKSANNNVANP